MNLETLTNYTAAPLEITLSGVIAFAALYLVFKKFVLKKGKL